MSDRPDRPGTRSLSLPSEVVFLAHVQANKPLVLNFPSGPVELSVEQMRAELSPEALKLLES